MTFYTDSWQSSVLNNASTPAEKALLSKATTQPWALWLGGSGDVTTVTRAIKTAAEQGTTPVFVMYNIPHRDCGSYSAGGAADGASYLAWVRQMAALMDGRAWIVLEPDAMGQASTCGGDERLKLLHDAGVILRAGGNRVYIDAGTSYWMKPATVSGLLKKVGRDAFDGISLNVSNFETTASSATFAADVSHAFGETMHFVVDTSRNGNGPTSDHAWCNPAGRALGERPHTGTGAMDAALWIKSPGFSDGTCNGGPTSGQFYKSYALELARNASW